MSSAVDGDSRAATVTITVTAVPPPVDPVDPVNPGNVNGNARRGGGAFGGVLLGGFGLLALLLSLIHI